jgi:acetyl esterase/lipase
MRLLALGTVVVLVALALLLPSRAGAADPPEGVSFQRDVEYGRVGDVSLKLNIAMPAGATGKLPVVLWIHGGAWRAGDRSLHDGMTWQFAQAGYVSATIGYRFVPTHVFPAQVEDVKCAVRFLRANAEKYHVDPERIGAVGFSAGAHLAMMLGTLDPKDGMDDSGGSKGFPSKVQTVVAFFGPTDFELPAPDQSRPLLDAFIGGPITRKREAFVRASPTHYVSKGDAPMLLLQGTADPLVTHAHATRMAEEMQEAGVPGRVELIVGGGHGNWSARESARATAAMKDFLAEHLAVEPAAAPAGAK